MLRLFKQSRSGRGYAAPEMTHALEISVFCMPYFEAAGLQIAENEQGEVIGFCHAGFAIKPDLTALDYSRGVICCILINPAYQKQGIGQELVHRAEAYLLSRGATSIQAGQSRLADPFYFGLYGGARPSGFLESSPVADPFFRSLGYEPTQRIPIFQRDLTDRRDPINIRLMNLRRQTELVIQDQPQHPSWWWFCKFGNLESMQFQLVEKKSQAAIASVTVVGLDHYIQAWHERAIGLVDILVEEKFRGQGFGQTLIIETLRRLRTEMITRAEIHIPDDYPGATGAALAAGFQQIDCGIVYERRNLPSTPLSSPAADATSS